MIDPRPLKGASIAVIDFETTGRDPATCRPVAVAVVIIDALGISEPRLAYSSLVNPGVPIPAEATAIHGITDADVRDAPCPATVCAKLIEVIGTRVVCAYNLPFDWRVWWGCRPAGAPPPLRGICALVIAREIDKYEGSRGLQAVAERRGITFDAHDAPSDAMTTARLLPGLLRQLGRGVRRYKFERWRLEGPWCRPVDLWSVENLWWWTRRAGARQERERNEYRAKNGEPPRSTPWLDLKATYEARDASPMRGTATPTPTTYEELPPDWIVPWQSQETAA